MTNTLSAVPQKLTKKEARQMVYEKLAGALAEYKSNFKEKKFENNLKRASKLFAADLAKTIGKKEKSLEKKKAKAEKISKKKEAKKKKEETPEQDLQVNHV